MVIGALINYLLEELNEEDEDVLVDSWKERADFLQLLHFIFFLLHVLNFAKLFIEVEGAQRFSHVLEDLF